MVRHLKLYRQLGRRKPTAWPRGMKGHLQIKDGVYPRCSCSCPWPRCMLRLPARLTAVVLGFESPPRDDAESRSLAHQPGWHPSRFRLAPNRRFFGRIEERNRRLINRLRFCVCHLNKTQGSLSLIAKSKIFRDSVKRHSDHRAVFKRKGIMRLSRAPAEITPLAAATLAGK